MLFLYILFGGIFPLLLLGQDYSENKSIVNWLEKLSTGQFILMGLIFLPVSTIYVIFRISKVLTSGLWSFLGKIGPKEKEAKQGAKQ